MFQSGSVGADPTEMILSFYDPLQKTSRVYFTKLEAGIQNEESKDDVRASHASIATFDSGGIDSQEVV